MCSCILSDIQPMAIDCSMTWFTASAWTSSARNSWTDVSLTLSWMSEHYLSLQGRADCHGSPSPVFSLLLGINGYREGEEKMASIVIDPLLPEREGLFALEPRHCNPLPRHDVLAQTRHAYASVNTSMSARPRGRQRGCWRPKHTWTLVSPSSSQS